MSDETARRTGAVPAPAAAPAVPLDYEAEANVLGTVLIAGGIPPVVHERQLRPEHFQKRAHQLVYAAMLTLDRRSEPIDASTVRAELERAGQLADQAVHPDSLTRATIDSLAVSVPAIGHAPAYVARVLEVAEWNVRYRAALEQLEAIAKQDQLKHERAVNRIHQLDDSRHAKKLLTPEDLGSAFFDWYTRPDEHPTIPWPLEELEHHLGGVHPGDSTVVSGWPGMGKSLFVDQWAKVAAERFGADRVCLYTNEMGDIHRTGRLLAALASVDYGKLMRRGLSAGQVKLVAAQLPNLPFHMQPCEGWTEDEIIRDLKRRRWAFAVLDRADLIPSEGQTKDYDRISRRLAVGARESDAHLAIVVQLNRGRLSSAVAPAPVKRDLRGTGAWEQDARNIVFVHRWQTEVDGGGVVTHEDGHVQVAKGSNTGEWTADVLLSTSSMQFLDKPSDFDPDVDRGGQW